MIFVIDDDIGFQMVLRRQFERLEWAEPVETFQYAHQALEKLRVAQSQCSGMPTRIFLDLEMPGMDGWDFLEEYGKFCETCIHGVDLYILTSNRDLEIIQRAEELALVKDYLIKPLPMDVLSRVLNNGYTAQSPSLF